MNRYESVLLDEMVSLHEITESSAVQPEIQNQCTFAIHVLLDCIVDFREPPGGTPVEDGYGAMVDKGASK